MAGHTNSTYPKESFLFMHREALVFACAGASCGATVETVSGSGFAVKVVLEGTVAITAGHVCHAVPSGQPGHTFLGSRTTDMSVVVHTGELVPAKILKVYLEEDLCVFLIKGVFLPSIPLATRAPVYGDSVHTLAAPLSIGEPSSVPIFVGHYSGVFTSMDMDAYTIPTTFGSSGSPILDVRGRLVGVTSRAVPSFPHVCFSPKFSSVKKLVDSLGRDSLPQKLSNLAPTHSSSSQPES
jgi:S1-C subfamily serine protease